MNTKDALDPKGLIKEAYRIDGISAPECRSIFLDWALHYQGIAAVGISALLERYSDEPREHPMTITLREGLTPPHPPSRRGGRRARIEDSH